MPARISEHSGGKRKFNSGQSKIMLVSRKHGSQQLHQGCWKADSTFEGRAWAANTSSLLRSEGDCSNNSAGRVYRYHDFFLP